MLSRVVLPCGVAALAILFAAAAPARAEGDWEVTPQSQQALERGLEWLARNQGPEGNWGSNDLGLVSMGALAFLSAGHLPGKGKYGESVSRSLDYVLRNAKPSGLLNIAVQRHDMYNHGLAAFVLGQAYGMTDDPRFGPVLERALKLIVSTQCDDGGWDYVARRQPHGHDLSLAVMQAKALRSAVDSGFEVPPEAVELAIKSVRNYYRMHGKGLASEEEMKRAPGQFTYNGSRSTIAMAAAGVVCMQEFGQYDDWRIAKNMDVICEAVKRVQRNKNSGRLPPPLDAYTLYYVGQALYQVGGKQWRDTYPTLRDAVAESQKRSPGNAQEDGVWMDIGRVRGRPGEMYGTAVACFILAMPNRYLPILQEGRIEGLKKAAGGKQ
jgi:hypothetical protein